MDSWPLVSSRRCGPAYPFLSHVVTRDCPAPTKAVPYSFQMSEICVADMVQLYFWKDSVSF